VSAAGWPKQRFFSIQPLQFLLTLLAGWINRRQLEAIDYLHEERNHQGLKNRLLKSSNRPIHRGGRVERQERLGAMLNFYRREAA
jgi:hypothetical protein